ncbi:sodium-dependent serotonin transporter-like [Plodia interpunctella]|uniref:sodium-dependent serotonin transporter-like n=1 Tax=Plodia interpunctella TaxID=58824 RepID=UPI0023675B41|nr:sodium-dependent serotonin transporter-like [Plodia interpunctella]
MPQHPGHIKMDLSSSMTLVSGRADAGKDHFKWDSIKTFLYLAFAFASCSFTFDMFSEVVDNVRLLDFILLEITLGMPYMFMDVFIKQYTRKIDFNQSLNPLLKGITYGSLLQTAMFALLHACDLTDGLEYLAMFLLMRHFRSACPKGASPNNCVERKTVWIQCDLGQITAINNTSVHVYYTKKGEPSGSTTKMFATAIVWICNFFFSTVSVDTLLLISKLSFLWRSISTCFLALSISFSLPQHVITSVISDIMSLNSPPAYDTTINLVTYIYGIGYLGVYDFQMISPFTMVDNTVVIFAVVFTLLGFIRSFVIKTLYKLTARCISINFKVYYHYLLFGILPFGADYLPAHILYLLVIYGNIIVAALAFLSTTTLTMSRLLRREFRSLKNVYIVGILCLIGFLASLPLAITNSTSSYSQAGGLEYGVYMTVLYLGGIKTGLIMWIYGVKKFSTDIHFWLGFKPTKFWTFCWSVLPIVLIGLCLYRVARLNEIENVTNMIVAAVWFLVSIIIVIIFQIRTIAKYMVGNHFINAFRNSRNYGPPDHVDREQRKYFSETLRLRKCSHQCKVYDETFDCNHMPLMSTLSPTLSDAGTTSSDELTNIYVANKEIRASTVEVNTYL